MVLFSSLEYIFTTIKTKFNIFIFCISTGPHGGMWNFQTSCTGGFNELISKFLSSVILYNHPSYFKSGERNSCRLSPLPNISFLENRRTMFASYEPLDLTFCYSNSYKLVYLNLTISITFVNLIASLLSNSLFMTNSCCCSCLLLWVEV